MIIDAHAHIFPRTHGMVAAGPTRGAGYGRVTIGAQEIQLLPPLNAETLYAPEMLLANMDWAGIDKAILLQGPFYGECNRYVSDALAHYGERLSGAAYFDPWSATGTASALDALLDTGAFRAVKLECSVATGLCGIHPHARLDGSETAWLWSMLEERRLVLVLDLGKAGDRSYQTEAVRTIAEQHRDLRIVIAHLGQPGPELETDPQKLKSWLDQIDLGRLPNVWFDTAALPAYFPDEDFPFPSAGHYLRLVVRRIGAHKVLWGTDQPGLLSVASLPQLVRMGFLHTEFLGASQQALILGENAQQVFNL